MDISRGTDRFHTSVEKALAEIDPKWESYTGLLVCGTHSPSPEMLEETIERLKQARDRNIPTLGICWGHQAMAIEQQRRNGYKKASTEELSKNPKDAVRKLFALRVGIRKVGERWESFWHNYFVPNERLDGFRVTLGCEYDTVLVDRMSLIGHPHYVGVQFHPEYQSTKLNPNPELVNFIEACKIYG